MKEESSCRCDWSFQAAMQLVSKARSLFTFIKHVNKCLNEQEWKCVHYLFVPRDVGRAVSEIRLACWSVVIPPVGRFIWLAPLRQKSNIIGTWFTISITAQNYIWQTQPVSQIVYQISTLMLVPTMVPIHSYCICSFQSEHLFLEKKTLVHENVKVINS